MWVTFRTCFMKYVFNLSAYISTLWKLQFYTKILQFRILLFLEKKVF